jgi:hypothetical protein
VNVGAPYCGTCNKEVPYDCTCEFKDRWVLVGNSWVVGAPRSLRDQRKAVSELPAPTLEEVRAQWRASAAQQASANPFSDAEELR